jgi:hypothetical protein
LRFWGITAGYKATELKINKQNCSLAKCKPIPQIEEDQIVLYAAVEGKDIEGVLRRREFQSIYFPKSGNYQLRAIQTTTAAPLVQASILLEQSYKGVLQSQINSEKSQRKLYRTCVRQNKTN